MTPISEELRLVRKRLFCHASGVIGSALGLIGSVAVCSWWVMQYVRFATSMPVWQHVQ